MLSEEILESLKKKITEELQRESCGDGQGGIFPSILATPSTTIVLLGLLAGVVTPFSLLVTRNKRIEIVLVGDLTRTTEVDKMVDGIGSHSFEEVMRSILGRFYG